MKKHKKVYKIRVAIVVFIIILMIAISVFGRYIYNNMREAYFTSKQFFFTSDLLNLNNQKYTYDDWGGMDVYEISIDLYSYANTLLRLDYDLNYEISCESLNPDKIKCAINSNDGTTSTTGVIYAKINGVENNVSKVVLYVTPVTQVNKGETVSIAVKAKTTEPYEKEISCEFSLKVKEQTSNSYKIEDEPNRNYAVIEFVNAQSSILQYTLTFDPNVVRIDTNDDICINKLSGTTTTINGTQYLNKVVFNMNKESSKRIKFYKVDMTKDYSYPSGDSRPIINVST